MAFADIKLGSSFDAKGFKQAQTASQKLEKNVKNLAKTFGLAFGATAVLRFGKASVKAFAEDDAAAKSLGKTLENLGLAYGANVGTVNGFINRLEAQTGVLDDELRPAMDRLLRATGDVAKSQELLNLSLDIAAGTGKTVTQVSQSLQKAYLGQTQAIGRLGVGISKAELATGNFEDIQEKLNLLFTGQASSAANTYEGSLNKLTVAGNNAKETIGKGLVDALAILSGSSTIDPTVTAIDKIAESIANATRGFADFIAVTKLYLNTGLTIGEDEKAAIANRKMRFTTPMSISSQDTQRADNAAAAKAKAAATKALAASKASAAAKIAADKKAAANKAKLDKAAAVLDIQKIQIAAALKGKISEEEKTRLLLMQAIEDGNADKAEALAKKLEEIQAKNAKIAADILAIGEATDPFAAWVTSLDAAALILGKMPALLDATGSLTGRGKVTLPTGDGLPGGSTSIYTPDMTASEIADTATAAADMAVAAAEAAVASVLASDPIVAAIVEAANAATGMTDVITNAPIVTESSSMFNPYGTTPGSSSGYGTQAPTIIVNNNGSVIMQDEFIDVVNDAVLASQRFGYGRTPAGAIL